MIFHSFLAKFEDIFRFMAQANNISKRLWNFYFKFIMCGFLFAIAVPTLVSILICWLWYGYFDKSLVFHPYKFVLVYFMIHPMMMVVNKSKIVSISQN